MHKNSHFPYFLSEYHGDIQKVMTALSDINLPGMKALWDGEIETCKRNHSLFTKHLDNSL
jgi:hypothetical protein